MGHSTSVMISESLTLSVKDSHPLPCICETLESLAGAAHYSTFNMNSGFWQVPMDEESKQYTAFMLGSMGLYECESMPFGLCNAPPTFQRLMLNCLGELNLTYCLIYLDTSTNSRHPLTNNALSSLRLI